MANVKISGLPLATAVAEDNEFEINESGTSTKVTAEQIKNYVEAESNTFTANQIISVTDNTNAALRITQAGTGDALLVEDEANPDSTPFVIKSDGKVGIGNPSPSNILDVVATEPFVKISTSSSGLSAFYQATTPIGSLYLGKDREGSSGLFGSAGEYVIAGTGNYPMDFWTNTVKRMSIAGNGNIFIGSNSALTGETLEGQLITSESASVNTVLGLRKSAASGNPRISQFCSSGTAASPTSVGNNRGLGRNDWWGFDGTNYINAAAIIAQVDADPATNSMPGRLMFSTTPAGGVTPVERVRITSTGDFRFNSGYGSVATAYGCRAWVNFDGSSNATNLTGTYSQTGTTVTVTITGHGYITGNSAFLDFTSGTAVDGEYEVTVTDANTFTVTQASRTTSGNVTDRRSNIRASGNVSSVADTGTGDYIVNFVTAMPDADYSVSGTAQQGGATRVVCPFVSGGGATSEPPTTTNFRVQTRLVGSSPTISDSTYVNVAVFR